MNGLEKCVPVRVLRRLADGVAHGLAEIEKAVPYDRFNLPDSAMDDTETVRNLMTGLEYLERWLAFRSLHRGKDPSTWIRPQQKEAAQGEGEA